MTTDFRAIAASIADELTEHPERWTQEAYCKNSLGFTVGLGSKEAVCWCIRGHLAKRGLDRFGSKEEERIRHIADVECLAEWNDTEGRTVQDIIALCRKVANSGEQS